MSSLLKRLDESFPYGKFMGFQWDIDEHGGVYGTMEFQDYLIGNPLIPALHGGGIAGFMEATALANLIYKRALEDEASAFEALPKTINITADYLRPGLAKTSFAKANIHRFGRRYASVHVLAWQDDVDAPIAESVGHFLVADWAKS